LPKSKSGAAAAGDGGDASKGAKKRIDDQGPKKIIVRQLGGASPRREPPFDPYITADGRRKKERYFKFPGVKRSDDSKDPLSLADKRRSPTQARAHFHNSRIM
jgi:hypothetical protein